MIVSNVQTTIVTPCITFESSKICWTSEVREVGAQSFADNVALDDAVGACFPRFRSHEWPAVFMLFCSFWREAPRLRVSALDILTGF